MSELITMDLIVVEQIPVIKERLKTVAEEIDSRLSIVDTLVCDEESVKAVKKIRTEFNKEFADAEKLRKIVKQQVLNPYDEFETVYKECISDKYKAAKEILDSKIKEVEDELRSVKIDKLFTFFNECAESSGVVDYADFERQIMPVFKMSTTETALKKICKERIESVVADIKAIETQPEELKGEILAEFKKSLSAAESISIVAERHKAIKMQLEVQAAREEQKAAEQEVENKVDAAVAPPLAPPTAPPVVYDDPVKTVTFKVTAPLSKLRELKKFIVDGGYKYE
ncbi:MAG: DUF1351 domain-containing protein [Oscillospiraceae bacterium]|nr:DUF1351 domain-containing protein [Oscillospiraceae bacterium]MCL2278133.1 DUF1351 domain-containing protein [Oscillospiraceae bacterium]